MYRRATLRAASRVVACAWLLGGSGCGARASDGPASWDGGGADATSDARGGSADAAPDARGSSADRLDDGQGDSSADGLDDGQGDSNGEELDHGAGDSRADAGPVLQGTDAASAAARCNDGGCATGCCDARGACQPGTSDTACGFGVCTDCTTSGRACLYQECLFPSSEAGANGGVCSAQTCPSGCCDLQGRCQPGLTGTACGNFGSNCLNCTANGATCSNQQCSAAAGPAACAGDTCGGCCDALGTCSAGTSDTRCGESGEPCADCAALGATCQAAACVAADGGPTCFSTCDTCCDALGNCQLGLLDTQCGAFLGGSLCVDCTHLDPPSTCDPVAGSCASQETACPATYAGCPAGLEESAPTPQHVCSPSDLQNVAAACAGGEDAPACSMDLFLELGVMGSSCLSCLQNFAFTTVSWTAPGRETDHPHLMQDAIRSCAAPYVDAACNHNSACVSDCLTEACYNCTVAMTECLASAQSGTCATYFAQDQCMTQALSAAAAFCNPDTYQGNFGLWLQAVGAQYCGD
jgi:hypothetical protein